MCKAKANISALLTAQLGFRALQTPPAIATEYRKLLTTGWRFYVVSQSRGRCYFRDKTITIPTWAYQDKREGYFNWYIAHEISHAITGSTMQAHGREFMDVLCRICPADYLNYEANYKPRELARAMIANGILPDDL